MESLRSSERAVNFHQTTLLHIPEDSSVYSSYLTLWKAQIQQFKHQFIHTFMLMYVTHINTYIYILTWFYNAWCLYREILKLLRITGRQFKDIILLPLQWRPLTVRPRWIANLWPTGRKPSTVKSAETMNRLRLAGRRSVEWSIRESGTPY
jgi:hypothetical protein